jgi:hypothetical protein
MRRFVRHTVERTTMLAAVIILTLLVALVATDDPTTGCGDPAD